MTGLRVITAPSVYVLGRPTFDRDSFGRFLADHGISECRMAGEAFPDGEQLVEAGARNCYQSWKGGRGHADHLRHLLEVGHGSTLEHANWTLLVAGVSRSLTHEMIRHRAGFGYSELSQRYVDQGGVAFVVPPALLSDVEAYRSAPREEKIGDRHRPAQQWCNACIRALADYGALTEYLAGVAPGELPATDKRKWARQAARSVLPECTETKVVVTGNARAWRHAIEMRASRHADAEIRRLFVAIWRALRNEAPNLFGDYTEATLPDGSVELTTPYRKV